MTEWTPKPGELVECIGESTWNGNRHPVGEWRIVCAYVPSWDTENKEGVMWLTPREAEDIVDCHLWKSLLPSVSTPQEAWEALKGLPGAEVEEEILTINMDTCYIHFRIHTGLHDSIEELFGLYAGEYPEWEDFKSACEHYEARGRDYQKEGAIREWLKQVGNVSE